MSDMYGAVRSNTFKVKDPATFREWFTTNTQFGESIELWEDADGTFSFGGYEQYPNAYPRMPRWYEDENGDEVERDDTEWNLEEFAAAMRAYLCPGEEFRVLAAGHEKLRYVSATHLIVTHETVTFNDYYEGN